MKWQPKHTSLLVIAIGFVILYFIFHKKWLLLPFTISLIGFLIGPIGEFVHHFWVAIAKVLSYINNRILLSLIFFIFLTPIALLMRLFKKSDFLLSLTHKGSSFVTRNHFYSKNDLQHPF
ncbi:SxtJ family membrane protein [Lacibacter sp. H407]|uniref:SxtJ family membrane protein n=1 Tax=Lacibacter sp. H407 TaxID=3133423 RepID=UPI00404026F9